KYFGWRSLRDSEDSRFLCLTLPRVLAPVARGEDTAGIGQAGTGPAAPHQSPAAAHRCWMNAAYVIGIIRARALPGAGWWTTHFGMAEGGDDEAPAPGRAGGHDRGGAGPPEIRFGDRHIVALGAFGLLPLVHDQRRLFPAAGGASPVHRPKLYDRPEATADAA